MRAASILTFACFVAGVCLLVPEREVFAQSNERVSEACLICHDGYDAGLARTPHRLSSDALDGAEARVACTDCHIGDARHYEEDPEEYKMPSLAAMSAVGLAGVCSTCHMNSHQQNMLERNVHTENDVNCSACHSIHGSSHRALLKQSESGLCLSCHTGVEGQFAQSYRHPVNDEIVRCSQCHLTLDATRRELSLNGTNSVCTECHSEFQGPFPYEHQATVDYSTEEGGCLNCHAAHGSHLPRMLTQPYEAPHFQLCSQCHVVPLHNRNSQHGTAWAGVACSRCHTDIHGSYVSRSFLDEALQGFGCFKVGCHKF
jgi:DmsE family decaheme c-type cytochrome